MRTVAIIPVFNNDRTVGDVIRKTRRHVDKVIVIDDGSTDDTPVILKRFAKRSQCRVLTQVTNLGKGEALRTAIRHLKSRGKGKGLEAVVFLDADGEHNPDEIPRFLEALERADVVLGARTSHRSKARLLLNRWMAFWFRLLDSGVSDPSCGFRAVRWNVLKKLELRSSDFCIDAEIILEAIKAGASVASIPVSLRTHSASSVSGADFLRMNNFFDRWVIHNARQLNVSTGKRLFLMTSASIGKALGTLLLGRSMRNV